MIQTKTAVLALVGSGCVAAAGLGAYLGVRSVAPAAAAPELRVATGQTAQVAEAPVAAAIEPSVVVPERRSVDTAPKPPAKSDVIERPTSRPNAVVERSESLPASAAAAEPLPSGERIPLAEPPPLSGVSAPTPTELAQPEFSELVIAADSVLGIRVDSPVSSQTARVEDLVSATLTREVAVDGQKVLSAGTKIEGSVTEVARGGKFKERARLGVRFHTIVLADRTRMPIHSEAVFREGKAPGNEAAAKIGASAVVGAIIGGIFGGKKGAAIGSSAGAASGTAAVMADAANEAVFAAGAPLTIRLLSPVAITVSLDR